MTKTLRPFHPIAVIATVLVIVGGAALVLSLGLHLKREMAARDLVAEIYKRGRIVGRLVVQSRRFESENGRIPESLQELREWVTGDLRESLERESDLNRDFSRALLLRNVETADDRTYSWIVILRIPQFKTLPEDVIFYGGETDDSLWHGTAWIYSSQARHLFGDAIVQQVSADDDSMPEDER